MPDRRKDTVVVLRRLPLIILPLAGTSCETLESHLIFLRLGFLIGKISPFIQITLNSITLKIRSRFFLKVCLLQLSTIFY